MSAHLRACLPAPVYVHTCAHVCVLVTHMCLCACLHIHVCGDRGSLVAEGLALQPAMGRLCPALCCARPARGLLDHECDAPSGGGHRMGLWGRHHLGEASPGSWVCREGGETRLFGHGCRVFG